VARDYLVYGRMLRPWKVSQVEERDFGWGKEPVVQSATWQAQDGRVGVVLANYGDLPQTPRLELEGTANKSLSIYNGDQKQKQQDIDLPGVLEIVMQPRTLYLIEVK
jgi:hypothetical protein